MGDPADIAAEAVARRPPRRRCRRGENPGKRLEVVALVMLLVGGLILPVIGWFVGVVFLWISETWSTGEKLLGTLLVPGGLALPLFLLTIGTSVNSCGGDVGGPITCTGGGNGTGSVAVAVLRDRALRRPDRSRCVSGASALSGSGSDLKRVEHGLALRRG